jgi:hypothetical protein
LCRSLNCALLWKLALETIFNTFATERISRSGQYHQIEELIGSNLRGDNRPVFRQILLEEFHFSAVLK